MPRPLRDEPLIVRVRHRETGPGLEIGEPALEVSAVVGGDREALVSEGEAGQVLVLGL